MIKNLLILIIFQSCMLWATACHGYARAEVVLNEKVSDLFILANAANYSFENAEAFSDARNIARNYISQLGGKCDIIVDEFKDLTKDDPYYSQAMYNLIGAPLSVEEQNQKQLLINILNRYSTCAKTEELKKQLTPKFESYLSFYRDNAEKIIDFTIDKLNISKSDCPRKISIIPNPLDSHYRGYNVRSGNKYYIIVGAGKKDQNLNTIIHELIHYFIDPYAKYLDDNLLDKMNEEYKQVKSKNRMIRDGYPEVRLYVIENIVIALEAYVASKYFHKNVFDFLTDYKQKQFIYTVPFLMSAEMHIFPRFH